MLSLNARHASRHVIKVTGCIVSVELVFRDYSMFKISFVTTEVLLENINSLLPQNFQGLETYWGLASTEIFYLSNFENPVVLIAPANNTDASDYPIGIFSLTESVNEIDWIGYNNFSSYSNTFTFDLNNDGLLDLFVPGQSGHNPSGTKGELPFLGINKSGSFDDISSDIFTELSYTHGWAFGDFDGNGYDDILLLNLRYDLDLPLTNLYLNNGDETFTSRRDLLPSAIAGDDAMSTEGPKIVKNLFLAVRSGDVDGDGDLDLVVPESDTNAWTSDVGFYQKKLNAQIWENDGTGKFEISSSLFPLFDSSSTTYFSNDLELEDIDNDGLPEVIYAVDTGAVALGEFDSERDYFDTEQLVIYQRQEDGDYKNIAPEIIGNERFKTYGYWPNDVSYVDINNDSYKDIIVSLSPWGGFNFTPAAVIYYGNGLGYFSPELVKISDQWAVGFKLFKDDSDSIIDAYQFTRGTTVEGNGAYIKISGELSEIATDRIGSEGDDLLIGFGDGATITPLGGDDKIVGAAGLDIVKFTQNMNDAKIQVGDDLSFVSVEFGSEVNILSSVERLQFSDKGIALDLEGNAGITTKILGAFLGPSGIERADLVGIGLELLDSGTTYEEFLQAALDAVFGSNPSGATLVNHFYGTLTGQSAPQSLIDQYGSLIDNGSLTPVSLAMQVAENELNIQNVDLVGLSSTGIEYT